jgi:hypothetical protein
MRIRYDHSVIDADRKNLCLLDYPDCDAVQDISAVRRLLEKAME